MKTRLTYLILCILTLFIGLLLTAPALATVKLALATDYCVKATALDGLRAGLKVTVVEDAIRGVDVQPGDAEKALAELQKAEASLVQHTAVSP